MQIMSKKRLILSKIEVKGSFEPEEVLPSKQEPIKTTFRDLVKLLYDIHKRRNIAPPLSTKILQKQLKMLLKKYDEKVVYAYLIEIDKKMVLSNGFSFSFVEKYMNEQKAKEKQILF